jgi:hypothetical protein
MHTGRKTNALAFHAKLAVAIVIGLASGSLMADSSSEFAPNPFSPAANHPHRHGVVATREVHANMKAWQLANTVTTTTGPQTLGFGGGVNGIGVTSGTPKVYLVVYGTQWGTAGTDANGNMTLSNDKVSAVPYLQNLFKHLGTGSELWSGVMTQYCDGPLVAYGATSCPSGAPHVGYPSGGAFAGIWYDNTTSSPSAATAAQLAQEAVKAAAHFGNTTAASNRYAQYVILSPSGTRPDGFNTPSGGFCAWHDYNLDVGVSSPYGDIAFTNMPYVYDAGASCGMGFVNGGAGTLDGYSLVAGHEYAETITDQSPAGGWVNLTSSTYRGQENGDECAWLSSGQGASQNVVMGTMSFPMQSTWSNDTNRCDIAHPIVTGGAVAVSISNPSNATVSAGTVASFSVSANGGTAPYAYQWYRNGTAIGGATSATYSFTAQTTDNGAVFKATVTDSSATPQTAVSGNAMLTVTNGVERIVNGGFENGTSPWTGRIGDIGNFAGETAYAGSNYAWLNGYGVANTESIAQTVSIPSTVTSATLSFYLHVDTAETSTTTAIDKLSVQIRSTTGSILQTLAVYSNLNHASGYQLRSFSLLAYKGKTIQIYFTGTENSSRQTSFVLDNVSLITR